VRGYDGRREEEDGNSYSNTTRGVGRGGNIPNCVSLMLSLAFHRKQHTAHLQHRFTSGSRGHSEGVGEVVCSLTSMMAIEY